MIQAIVYTSSTGSCKKYAEILSRKLAVPVYAAKSCPVSSDFEIVYVGWLMNGKVAGLPAALKKYNVRAVVPVGMGDPAALTEEVVRAKNGLSADVAVFPQQGAFHMDQLSLPMRAVMNAVNKNIVKRLDGKSTLNDAEKALLKMAKTGDGEPATWDDIDKAVAWVKADNNPPDVMKWYEP